MKTYSPERKAAVIARMLPPHNQSINQIARQENIPPKTLYHWRSSVGITDPAMPAGENLPREWSQGERFAILIETAPLSAHAVAEYCRRKGLYPDEIQQWKDQFMQPNQREEKAEIKRLKKENQQLNREIARKDKALAEATALLVLEKKFKALFGEEGEDEARTNDARHRPAATDSAGPGSDRPGSRVKQGLPYGRSERANPAALEIGGRRPPANCGAANAQKQTER